MIKKKVVVFGIFDGVHDGHRDFFRQAKEFGDELIVIVGRDSVAKTLKGKAPKHSEHERVKSVEQEETVGKAMLGDKEISVYKVLKKIDPDVVCLGYDQGKLGSDLKKWQIFNKVFTEIHQLKSYKEETLHNSLL